MSTGFQVSLTDTPANAVWGETRLISYSEHGATIHLGTDDPLENRVESIQQAARSLAKMRFTDVVLHGQWSLEEQWHFWLGLYQSKARARLHFAALASEQQQLLENRVRVYEWVRDIINQTPQQLSPMLLAQNAADFISTSAPQDSVSYQIIQGDALAQQGYVGIHGVGRGSDREPALLSLDFCPPGCESEPPVAALVGKGITFDSGGYSMKSSQGMLHMKCDMGGAATVAGALALAILNGLEKRVRLYLCCAENLVSGHAYKLSDILHYRNDVSVEVVNTDAEGRLVLADGLIDASRSGAPVIIDAATLTGAAQVAVGQEFNAMFSMDDALAQRFDEIAEENHDQVWRLPLSRNHRRKFPSAWADTANSRPMPGGGAGGASNAAGFLSRFLENPEQGWIHLDLAACYHNAATRLWAMGATGRGVRSIAALLNELE